jgi:soluble lytic murein transglycosylase-like protein
MGRIALLAVALCALTPSLAQAQLYSWTDASGRLIISDRPQDPDAKTYSVAYVGSATPTQTDSNYGVTRKAVGTRGTAYDDLIAEHATKHSLEPGFVKAVIQAESAFNPWARSIKGAMGLMQLMPSTAAAYKVTNAYDPAQNIRAGVAYLKSLLTRFNNDVSLALAAYNAGPGAVKKYGNTVPPYKETRNYVTKIRKNAGVDNPVRPSNALYAVTEIVDGKKQIRYYDKPRPGAIVVR